MPGNLRRRLQSPLRTLHALAEFLLRLWGPRVFLAAVQCTRSLRVLPHAYQAGRDSEAFLVCSLTPHLGDAIMLMPMLQALKRAHPDTPIDLAVEQNAAPLLEHMPELRSVYRLRLGTEPPIGSLASIRRITAVLREYRRHMLHCRPSVCVNPRWGDDLFRSSYLAVLTGAPRRIGFAGAAGAPQDRLAHHRDRLLTEAVQAGSGMHEPARFVLLLERVGLVQSGLHLSASTSTLQPLEALAARADWNAIAERLHLPRATPFAVIAPGASQPKKMWDAQKWCQVVDRLRQMGLPTVLLSGAQDAAVANSIHLRSTAATILAAGRTTLAESAALLQHAEIFLGSDSGPGHIAGPLGTPSVILFIASRESDPDNPFSPVRNRPMGPQVRVCQIPHTLPPCVAVCSAETSHCIQEIVPDDVMQHVQTLLANGVFA